MIRQRVLRGTLLGAALVIAAAAPGCGRLAVWTAPAKVPTVTRTAAAVEADKLFWKTLHAGEYDRIPDALTALKAAYLENPRDAVTATLRDHLGRGLDDCSFTTVDYGDVPAFVEAGYFAPGTFRDCVIVGERGTLAADFGSSEVRVLANRHVETPSGWQAPEGAVESLKASGPEPLRHELELFLDAVTRRSRPAVDVQAGLDALRTVESALRSSALGRRVTLAELA